MKRILVIDDDAQLRQMLTTLLTRKGFQVKTAENGKAGLDLAQRHRFDLVITDIFMPEKEGLETIQEFRQRFAGTPLIAISGGSKAFPIGNFLNVARQLGAVACLEKPFPMETLLHHVMGIIGEAAQRDPNGD